MITSRLRHSTPRTHHRSRYERVVRSNGSSAVGAGAEAHDEANATGTPALPDAPFLRASAASEPDPARSQAERDRPDRQDRVHDLEAHALVLTHDDRYPGDPDPECPDAQTRRGSTRLGGSSHGSSVRGVRDGGEAAFDRGRRRVGERACGRRASAMRPCAWSTPFQTAGFGSANPARITGRSASACGAAVVDLARERAFDHRDEPRGAQVRRRGDPAGGAHAHRAGTRGSRRRSSRLNPAGAFASTSSVSVSSVATDCFTPAMFGMRAISSSDAAPEPAARAHRNVVDDRPVRGSRRRRPG